MINGIDIDEGGTPYLGFAKNMLAKLKVVLNGCGLNFGRKHMITPDGNGSVYVRTRRGPPAMLTQEHAERAHAPFSPEGRIDEWYDYIKIESGIAGGYLFKPYIYFRQVSNGFLSATSLTGATRKLFLPLDGGKFSEVVTLGSNIYPWPQYLGSAYETSKKAITGYTNGYVRDGTLTGVPFNTYYDSVGYFRHKYTDEFGAEQERILSVCEGGTGTPYSYIRDASTGAALTSTGAPSTTLRTPWAYTVSDDGRSVMAHALTYGWSYLIDVDYARTPQLIYKSLSSLPENASPPQISVNRSGSQTVSTTTFVNCQRQVVGLDYTAHRGDVTYESLATGQGKFGVEPWSQTKRDNFFVRPDGSVGWVEYEYFVGPSVNTYEYNTHWWTDGVAIPVVGDCTTNSAYDSTFTRSGNPIDTFQAEAGLQPYADMGFSSPNDDTCMTLPQKVVIKFGGSSHEFALNSATLTDERNGGDYRTQGFGFYDGIHYGIVTPATAWPFENHRTYTITRVGGQLNVLYVDPVSEVLFYEYLVNTYTYSESQDISGDYVVGGPADETSSYTSVYTKTREVGMISTARGRETLWIESATPVNDSGTPASIGFPPILDMSGYSGVYFPGYPTAPFSGTLDYDSGVSGGSSFLAFSFSVLSAMQRNALPDSAAAGYQRISCVGKDPNNWVADVLRVRTWPTAAFLNPNVFYLRTARLNDAAIYNAWLTALEGLLRAVGQTAVADNVAAGNVAPYELKLHGRTFVGISRRNDSVATVVLPKLR